MKGKWISFLVVIPFLTSCNTPIGAPPAAKVSGSLQGISTGNSSGSENDAGNASLSNLGNTTTNVVPSNNPVASESPSVNSSSPTAPPAAPVHYGLGVPYPDAVRGIYVTAYSAGGSRLSSLLKLVDNTKLNTVVIDLKDDSGHITFPVNDPALKPYSSPIISNPNALMAKLKAHHIYPIARIVVFKDTVYAQAHPADSFQINGHVWHNGNGDAFVNPFLSSIWKYNVDVAKQAAELGFEEIQFDYVRFPEGFETMDRTLQYSLGPYVGRNPSKFVQVQEQYQNQKNANQAKLDELTEEKTALEVQLQATDPQQHPTYLRWLQDKLEQNTVQMIAIEKSIPTPPHFTNEQRLVQLRVDAVTDFVAYARQQLQPYGVKVGVDIFGYSATLPEAPGIGQNYYRIGQNVDVISPMIYPSHWGPGYFGIAKPDLQPYELVTQFEKAEQNRLAGLAQKPVQRPWIQDFTASWLGTGNYQVYGKSQVEAQIQALEKSGVDEFMLWNAGNDYTQGVDYTP